MSTNKMNGYGEFVVYRKSKIPISKLRYDQIYSILLKYQPMEMLNSNIISQYPNRHQHIKSELNEIDLDYEILFIPRILYDLIFIKLSIEEDLQRGRICKRASVSYLNPSSILFDEEMEDFELRQKIITRLKTEALIDYDKCWHLCCFETSNPNFMDPALIHMSYRLNNEIVKQIIESETKYDEKSQIYKSMTNEILSYLEFQYNLRNLNGEIILDDIGNCNYPGTTSSFLFESTRGSIKSMGIRNQTDKNIILKVLELECSSITVDHILIYRGSNFEIDNPVKDGISKSLSYGTSVFAGCMFDGGATAFHYMRNHNLDAYAIPIRIDQISSCCFNIPNHTALSQLLSTGETFHVRSINWNDKNKSEIIENFENLKKTAVKLK